MNFLNIFFALYINFIFGTAFAEGRIGLVDLQAIIINSEEGKYYRGLYEKEIQKKEDTLIKLKKEIEEIDSQINRTNEMNEKKKIAEKLSDKYNIFIKEKNLYESYIKKTEEKVKNQVTSNVYAILGKISKKNNLDYVFDKNIIGLLYVRNPLDITKDTLEEYNKEFRKRN